MRGRAGRKRAAKSPAPARPAVPPAAAKLPSAAQPAASSAPASASPRTAAPPAEKRSISEQLRSAMVPAAALLPLRFFLGGMFVYAGLDKLLDPAFFDASQPGSIQSQFAAFERFSPLGPLVHVMAPLAVPLGLLIALGEIGVGLGALTGLAYRLAALGGAFFGVLFFLTASWNIHPYYLGPDLPYAFAWLTLALAGHGNLLVVPLARAVARARAPAVSIRAAAAQARISRRDVLQVGALAAMTLFVGAVAGGVRAFLLPAATPEAEPSPTPIPGTSPTPPAPGSPSPNPTSVPGVAIANVADVERVGAQRFRVPVSAPRPLPAGDPGLVIKLDDGTFVAFDAICTHQGCRVGWDPLAAVIACPCHGAEFDAASHGAVIAGPTRIPLVELPIVVDSATGTIVLRYA